VFEKRRRKTQSTVSQAKFSSFPQKHHLMFEETQLLPFLLNKNLSDFGGNSDRGKEGWQLTAMSELLTPKIDLIIQFWRRTCWV